MIVRRTYRLMLLSVLVGQSQTFLAQVLLHCWVHGQLFAYRVPGKGPGKLIAPLDLVFGRPGGSDIFCIEVEGFVILANGFRDGV